MAVLIDSSVWISAQVSKNPEFLALRRLIAQNELIYITDLIQVEVCQGAKTEALFHRLWDGFMGFDRLLVQDHHWNQTAWNFFKCRKKGLTLSTIDCLIGTLASDYRVPLWTLDRHFEKSQPIIGFELVSYP